MRNTDIGGRLPRSRLQHALACAALLTLAGCGGEGTPDAGDSSPGPGAPPGPGSGNPLPLTTLDLARSSLEASSKLVAIANIVNSVVHDHIDLVSSGDPAPRNIAQCAASPDGYAFETNQVSYRHLDPGFMMPGGPSLHVALSQCTIEGVLVSGFIDITAIDYRGNPGGSGDWDLAAEVWLSPAQIHNDNGTVTSLTDHYAHRVSSVLDVLDTAIEIGADPGAGLIGGLNGQYAALPLTADSAATNFQFRPFRIATSEDPNAGEYRLEITNHSDGPSTLSRYTNGADDEVLLRIETLAGEPLRWLGLRPVSYTQTPVSGSVSLTDTCAGCDRIQVDVNVGGAILTLESGGSVTTEAADWSVLLSPPPPP